MKVKTLKHYVTELRDRADVRLSEIEEGAISIKLEPVQRPRRKRKANTD